MMFVIDHRHFILVHSPLPAYTSLYTNVSLRLLACGKWCLYNSVAPVTSYTSETGNDGETQTP